MTHSRTVVYNLSPLLWWLGFFALVASLLIYGVALPARYNELSQAPASNDTVALVQVVGEGLVIALSAVLSLLLVIRRRRDRIAMLSALVMVLVTPNVTGLSLRAKELIPLLELPGVLMVTAVPILAYWWLLALPDGHIIFRRLRWGIIPLSIWEIARNLIAFSLEAEREAQFRLNSNIIGLIVVFVAFGAMILRFRKYATTNHKQQFKLFFVGICVATIGITISIILRLIAQRFENPEAIVWVGMISSLIVTGCGFFSRFMLVMAVTRRGLWNVDLSINRGIVTGIVGLLLFLIFGTVFFGVQAGLRLILGENRGEIAVAVAALLVGLGFNPIHHHVRNFVDRRLFGFRFDLNQLEQAQHRSEIKNEGLLTGKSLGGYELLGVLGRGGMGEVYKGFANGKLAAIKILSDSQNQGRFEREGAIKLEHPNIVKTYDFGEFNGQYYLALEYIEGQTLKTMLQEREQIPFHEIQSFLPTIAKAIDFAHEQGYVHRDIKPSNIMLRQKEDGTREAVLMDFGLVKLAGETTSLTGSGAIGTIDYMAPEQIMDSGRVDHRADIYALGVVLYEVLTGKMPFEGTVGQVLFAHLQQPPPNLLTILPDAPQTLADAIQRALAKDPEDRFQSAGDFLAYIG